MKKLKKIQTQNQNQKQSKNQKQNQKIKNIQEIKQLTNKNLMKWLVTAKKKRYNRMKRS